MLSLYSPETLIKSFRNYTKKSLGQNFLRNQRVCSLITQQAMAFSPTHLIEIGPGVGSLTLELLKSEVPVYCMEKDERCVSFLSNIFGNEAGFHIRQADALKDSFPDFVSEEGHRVVIVSNLPYNVATQIYFRLIDEGIGHVGMILMFQKEVGMRFIASPSTKSYGILSLVGRYHHRIDEVLCLGPESFFPAPKVDSMVLRFEPIEGQLSCDEEVIFRRLVKKAFSTRRKTLLNSLLGIDGLTKSEVIDLLEGEGISGSLRAENLDLEDFMGLSRALSRVVRA